MVNIQFICRGLYVYSISNTWNPDIPPYFDWRKFWPSFWEGFFSLKIEDDSRFQVSTTAFEKQIWPMRMSFPNRSRNNSRPKNITCRSNGPPFRCWNLWMLPFLVIPLMKAVGFSEVKSHENTGSLRRKRHLGPVVVVRGWWVAQIGPFGCPSFKPSNSFSNDNQNDWTKESFGQRSRIKMPKKRSGPVFFLDIQNDPCDFPNSGNEKPQVTSP